MSVKEEQLGAALVNENTNEKAIKILDELGKIKYDTQNVNGMLTGKSTPYGNGMHGNVVYDADNFTWVKDSFGRYIIQAASFYLPEGVTMTPPDKHNGIYLFCQGDVTIDGVIDVGCRLNVTADHELIDYVEVEGVQYPLAKGGNTVNGGNGGNGGKVSNHYGTTAYGGNGGNVSNYPAIEGSIIGGGLGHYGVGASGGRTYYGTAGDRGSDGAVICMEDAPAAICIVCAGTFTVNGTINANALAGENAKNGSSVKSSSGSSSASGGNGGNGAKPPSGAGAITIIAKKIAVNGTMTASGEKLVCANGTSYASSSATATYTTSSDKTYTMTKYGGSGGKGGTFISQAGEIKVYETGGGEE